MRVIHKGSELVIVKVYLDAEGVLTIEVLD